MALAVDARSLRDVRQLQVVVQSPGIGSVFSLACISNAIYALDDKPGDVAALNVDTGNYEVIPSSIRTEGIKMAVWQNNVNGNTVLAFKGTDFGRGEDIKNDLALGTGLFAKSMADSTSRKAEELIQQFNVNMVTGHSLGAYFAEVVASNTNLPGIAFCAPGTIGPLQRESGRNVSPNFHNVNFEHDLLGNIGTGIYQHTQWSVYVPNLPLHPYQHSITYMIRFFKDKQQITNMNILQPEYTSSTWTGYYLKGGYPNSGGWSRVRSLRTLDVANRIGII